jgi:hypothetical protein
MAIQSSAEFAPFFGCSLTDAILCSCAAVPFFAPAHVRVPGAGIPIEVIDGGFVANNPSFYAVADALQVMKNRSNHSSEGAPERIRVLSVGVGVYPVPQPGIVERIFRRWWPIQLVTTMFEASTNAARYHVKAAFPRTEVVRGNSAHTELQTTLLESDPKKLHLMHQLGYEDYAEHQEDVEALFPRIELETVRAAI